MYGTEIASFEKLLLLNGVVQSDEILREILRFEMLLQRRSANGTASQLLLFNL
jgi:hypothetical protein